MLSPDKWKFLYMNFHNTYVYEIWPGGNLGWVDHVHYVMWHFNPRKCMNI